MHNTIVMLRQLNADDKVREEAYYREKQLHDEASALGGAKSEGRIEERNTIENNMRKAGFTEEQIKLALGENYTT